MRSDLPTRKEYNNRLLGNNTLYDRGGYDKEMSDVMMVSIQDRLIYLQVQNLNNFMFICPLRKGVYPYILIRMIASKHFYTPKKAIE